MKPDKKYQDYCANCRDDAIEPMSYHKWQKNHSKSADNLIRWNNARTAPSVWDKIDKDPEYKAILNTRIKRDDDGTILSEKPTMSNRVK